MKVLAIQLQTVLVVVLHPVTSCLSTLEVQAATTSIVTWLKSAISLLARIFGWLQTTALDGTLNSDADVRRGTLLNAVYRALHDANAFDS